MARTEVERELFDSVGPWLSDIAWEIDLPIYSGFGLGAVFTALEDNQVNVKNIDTTRCLNAQASWKGTRYSAPVEYVQLITGYKNHPFSSPRTFGQACYQVIHAISSNIPEELQSKFHQELFQFTHEYPKKIRQSMEDILKQYFTRFHEHLLIPSPFDPNSLPPVSRKEPTIFDRVMESYPLFLHERVKAWSLESKDFSGITAECLNNVGTTGNFDLFYHPSELELYHYFQGIYLEMLARDKGYIVRGLNTNSPVKTRRAILIRDGAKALNLS
jgi:hypothetical protein